jgi:hypothetical protein
LNLTRRFAPRRLTPARYPANASTAFIPSGELGGDPGFSTWHRSACAREGF